MFLPAHHCVNRRPEGAGKGDISPYAPNGIRQGSGLWIAGNPEIRFSTRRSEALSHHAERRRHELADFRLGPRLAAQTQAEPRGELLARRAALRGGPDVAKEWDVADLPHRHTLPWSARCTARALMPPRSTASATNCRPAAKDLCRERMTGSDTEWGPSRGRIPPGGDRRRDRSAHR